MKSKKEILEMIKSLEEGMEIGLVFEAEGKSQIRALMWAIDFQIKKPEWMQDQEWRHLTEPEPEEEVSPWERL